MIRIDIALPEGSDRWTAVLTPGWARGNGIGIVIRRMACVGAGWKPIYLTEHLASLYDRSGSPVTKEN